MESKYMSPQVTLQLFPQRSCVKFFLAGASRAQMFGNEVRTFTIVFTHIDAFFGHIKRKSIHLTYTSQVCMQIFQIIHQNMHENSNLI